MSPLAVIAMSAGAAPCGTVEGMAGSVETPYWTVVSRDWSRAGNRNVYVSPPSVETANPAAVAGGSSASAVTSENPRPTTTRLPWASTA